MEPINACTPVGRRALGSEMMILATFALDLTARMWVGRGRGARGMRGGGGVGGSKSLKANDLQTFRPFRI